MAVAGIRFVVAAPILLKRQEIVAVLRRAGLPELAEEANRSLPDEVDIEQAARFGERYGVTRDWLISQFGGSP